METCNPLLREMEEGNGKEEKVRGWERRGDDMWDGGLEEGDFASHSS